MRPSVALVAVVLLPVSRPSLAQGPDPGWVSGVVKDSLGDRPLAGALVYFGPLGAVRTGADGSFRIERTTAGDTLLAVRRIGYVPAYVRLSSDSPDALDLGPIYLSQIATPLDRIAVEAEEVRVYPHLAGFYRRKQEGLPGNFFTRDDIERSGVRKPSEMLRRTAKVEMDCREEAVRFGVDGCVARDRRGRDIRLTRRGDYSLLRCEMRVYVDGLRSDLRVDEMPIEHVAAIEVYSGPATTPTQFGNGQCGVVAIWTTGGPGAS